MNIGLWRTYPSYDDYVDVGTLQQGHIALFLNGVIVAAIGIWPLEETAYRSNPGSSLKRQT